MNTTKLEQLRIERKTQTEASGAGRWWWLLAIIVVVLAFVAWTFAGRNTALAVATAPATRVNSESVSTVLNASGYVSARRQATVSSEVTGKVVEVLIEEGMTVLEGEVLARLDDANIRASYDLAQAQLEASRSSLAETEALLKEANANLERTENLVRRELASLAELDRAKALAGSLEAQLARRQADIEVSARHRTVWREQLDDTVIRAPFNGVVVAKNAQPGEMISPVSAGGGFTRTGIGTIVDMDSLEIEIDVNEAYINRVSAGQKVLATLDAYPDWNIPCTVIAIIPTADRQRATVEVRAGYDELDPRILPDMGVKVEFQDSVRAEAGKTRVAIPLSALNDDDGTSIVFVLSGTRVERRAVSVAERRDGEAFLEAGLNVGERVVINAPSGLADGTVVEERQQ
jgi:RND family efflux transporter MFP subunit